MFYFEPPADDWLPGTALCDGSAVPSLVATIADRFGTAERRVAASLVVLGYSARLIAPGLSTLMRSGILPDLRPCAVRWRYRGAGFQVGLAGTRRGSGTLEEWHAAVIDDHLVPVIASVREVVPVSAGLLWGNVASSLTGTLRILAASGDVPVARALESAQYLLDLGPMRESGALTCLDGGLSFVRRSCCLYYRLPGGGKCLDCALLT